MEFVSQLGSDVIDSVGYVGALATLGSRAAYYVRRAVQEAAPLTKCRFTGDGSGRQGAADSFP